MAARVARASRVSGASEYHGTSADPAVDLRRGLRPGAGIVEGDHRDLEGLLLPGGDIYGRAADVYGDDDRVVAETGRRSLAHSGAGRLQLGHRRIVQVEILGVRLEARGRGVRVLEADRVDVGDLAGGIAGIELAAVGRALGVCRDVAVVGARGLQVVPRRLVGLILVRSLGLLQLEIAVIGTALGTFVQARPVGVIGGDRLRRRRPGDPEAGPRPVAAAAGGNQQRTCGDEHANHLIHLAKHYRRRPEMSNAGVAANRLLGHLESVLEGGGALEAEAVPAVPVT